MPYALLGPALSLAGLLVLYISVNGLPATAEALFARAGRPATGEKRQTQRAGGRAGETAKEKAAARPRREAKAPVEPPKAPRRRKEAAPPASEAPGATETLQPPVGLRYPGLYLALAATLFAGLGSGYAIGKASSPPPNEALVAAAQVTATPARSAGVAPGFVVTTTPEGDRRDCAAVHGSEYRSDGERAWYLANCYEVEAESITVWTIATRTCQSGLAFAAQGPLEPDLAGKVLCADGGFMLPPEVLRIAGPFGCEGGVMPSSRSAVLTLAGRRLPSTELGCPD
jgi:hypothetical protein